MGILVNPGLGIPLVLGEVVIIMSELLENPLILKLEVSHPLIKTKLAETLIMMKLVEFIAKQYL